MTAGIRISNSASLVNTASRSRGPQAPRFARNFLALRSEGAGNTGCALHPRSRVQKCTKKAHEHTGSAEAIRHSLRNGFTAYFVLSPATGLFCHRRPRKLPFANLTPASGRQDHTSSPSAAVYAKGFDGLGTRPPKL